MSNAIKNSVNIIQNWLYLKRFYQYKGSNVVTARKSC